MQDWCRVEPCVPGLRNAGSNPVPCNYGAHVALGYAAVAPSRRLHVPVCFRTIENGRIQATVQ